MLVQLYSYIVLSLCTYKCVGTVVQHVYLSSVAVDRLSCPYIPVYLWEGSPEPYVYLSRVGTLSCPYVPVYFRDWCSLSCR